MRNKYSAIMAAMAAVATIPAGGRHGFAMLADPTGEKRKSGNYDTNQFCDDTARIAAAEERRQRKRVKRLILADRGAIGRVE